MTCSSRSTTTTTDRDPHRAQTRVRAPRRSQLRGRSEFPKAAVPQVLRRLVVMGSVPFQRPSGYGYGRFEYQADDGAVPVFLRIAGSAQPTAAWLWIADIVGTGRSRASDT